MSEKKEEQQLSRSQIVDLADKLDRLLETWSSPKKVMDFLTVESKSLAGAVDVCRASLLAERMFNADFALKLEFGYVNFLLNILPKLDGFTRTHFVWQILRCSEHTWCASGKILPADAHRIREKARECLTTRDYDCHPYTGSMTSWLQPFDDTFYRVNNVAEASALIPDTCFAEFSRYVKDSLWLSRMYQADFFAVSSIAKQMHMHQNLDKVPALPMLKFVSQILHSGLDQNIKLAFWKRVNELDELASTKTLSSSEGLMYLKDKCVNCKPLVDAMYQFPKLYDKIFELRFSKDGGGACFDWLVQDDEAKQSIAHKLIDEHSSFAEVAVKLMVNGEELKSNDVEYMLAKRKFSMVGEMVKDDLEFVSTVLPLDELLFLVLKHVKTDLCIECLESFEKFKPGFIESHQDYYGNNALWNLLHRKVVAHPISSSAKKRRKSLKQNSGDARLFDVLTKKYGCKVDAKNIYGLSYKRAVEMLERMQ